MDVKLQDFAARVVTLSEIRNIDARNPIEFDQEHPATAMQYRVVGSIAEPSHMGLPINCLWVVMDGNSLYYKQVLKLKSREAAADSGIEGAIVDQPLTQTWVVVDEYLDIFADPQYYDNGSGGGIGPAGPKGDPGYNVRGAWAAGTYGLNDTVTHEGSSYVSLADDNAATPPAAPWSLVAQKGDSPEVDNESIIEEVIRRLRPRVTGITLSGLPTLTTEGLNYQLQVIATYNNGTTKALAYSDLQWDVTPNAAGAVDSSNRFVAAQVNADVTAQVTAVYVEDGVQHSSYQNTTVRNKVPVSLSVTGPAQINEGGTGSYSASVTYSTGETSNLSASAVQWGVSNAAMGTISNAGVLTAAQVNADLSGNVTASYTEGGVNVTGNRAVVIKNVVVANKARYGVGPATAVANLNSAFINALTNQVANAGLTNTFTQNDGANNFQYFAHPKSMGTARFEEASAPGFYGGWDGAKGNPLNPSLLGPVEVQATVNGVTEAWLVYRTDFANLGNTTWNVTPQP